jgi:hypothetical protein
MNKLNQHIISSLSWNTSFDRKERAAELQARLSTWTNMRLPGELSRIFDSLCPPGQTWKIGSMELDLGTIGYNELEPELSLRVKKQLLEKLLALVRYSAEKGSTNFEISDENASELELVSAFLATGVMPWNRTPDRGSAEAMMKSQLKHNRTPAIEMLWETGAIHDNVRKRIAWQFSDPVVISIIEGLEPNNHEQIISFSDKMIEVQAKETIVKTNITDLRKNIWHWVLNYLYNERGTVFNKMAFMKSTIRQMAAHHNVRYEELVDLIDLAVNKIKQRTGLPSGFIATLQMLADENTNRKKEIAPPVQETDHWQELEMLLRDPSHRSASRAGEINDLVAGLYRNDKQRLGSLLHTIFRKKELRISAIDQLNVHSLEIIFSALLPSTNGQLLQSIHFLQALGKKAGIWKEDKVLWRAALKFAAENKSVPNDNEIFITYCIKEMAGEIGLPAEKIFTQLLSSPISAELKTIASLEIYSDLLDATKKAGGNISHELLIAFLQADKKIGLLNRNDQVAELEETLKQYISRELLAAVSQAEQVLAELKRNNRATELAEALQKNMHAWISGIIIRKPGMETTFVLEYIFTRLFLQHNNLPTQNFILLFTALADTGNPVLKNAAEKMLRKKMETGRLPLTERIKWLILQPEKTQAAVGKLLSEHFSDAGFSAWRKVSGNEAAAVLDFLVTGGEKCRVQLVTEYKNALRPFAGTVSEPQLELQLGELFWKCIVDYDAHRGSIAALKKLFREAVLYKFPLSEKDVPFIKQKKTKPAGAKIYLLKNGDEITLQELFRFISVCFEEAKEELSSDGKKYELAELLELGLELKPSEIRKIISRVPLTDARLQLLKTTGSFQRLSFWIMSDLRGEMNAAMEAIRMLHDMIMLVVPGNQTEKFLDECWRQVWTVIATGSWSREDLKNLLRNSLAKIAAEYAMDAATFLGEMKNKKIRLSPLLRDELIACFPAFASLPENEKETATGRTLAGFERKGLLDSFIDYLVVQKKTPAWFGNSGEEETRSFLQEIIVHYPVKFLQAAKREAISESRMQWLSDRIDFSELTRSIGYLSREHHASLSMLEEFHAALGKITIPGIPAGLLQEILFSKLIKAWTENNWRLVTTENIWNEITWDICVKHNIQKKDFIRGLGKYVKLFPPAIQIALEKIITRNTESRNPTIKTMGKKKLPVSEKINVPKTKPSGILVYNAGIVILNTYIPVLFERLRLVNEKKFIGKQEQDDAVHYLQYVVTGLDKTEESFLPLNKVLCGLPLSHPATDGITITNEQKILVDGLIKAAISHWPVIGETSIEGFRGNWLVREGMLIEMEDRWELNVEKRSYDILLNKSPYSFSIIKYPWMEKPLHVTWPY